VKKFRGGGEVVRGKLPMMDYTGMLCLKGVPFWASGIGKVSLFQAGGM